MIANKQCNSAIVRIKVGRTIFFKISKRTIVDCTNVQLHDKVALRNLLIV